MKSLKYRRQWRAMETIKRALADRTLVSWYTTDHYYVVIVRKSL